MEDKIATQIRQAINLISI